MGGSFLGLGEAFGRGESACVDLGCESVGGYALSFFCLGMKLGEQDENKMKQRKRR